METFLQYLSRKITGKAPDKHKILFSTRVKQNIFFRILISPYKLIIAFRNLAGSAYRLDLAKRLTLLENAIIDPQGLGGLDLKLHNAHIPQQYYDIFYKLPFIAQSHKSQIGGGAIAIKLTAIKLAMIKLAHLKATKTQMI